MKQLRFLFFTADICYQITYTIVLHKMLRQLQVTGSSRTRSTGADAVGMQGMHPPHQTLNRCWNGTWFHWKSPPKIFLCCTSLNR